MIGAGPSGSIASALLHRRGWDVVVLERQAFPRFSIGESLLAHCLDFVEEAGMMPAVEAAGFQRKDGASFWRGDSNADFDFAEKSTPGRNFTYQVERAKFDKVLADGAALQGVEIRYQTEILAIDTATGSPVLTARDPSGRVAQIGADFVFDASGFGRTLPRLLGLEVPSAFPVRHAIFTHIADGISDGAFDRNKIRVVIHPRHREVWYWLIPFAAGRASIGVVAHKEFLTNRPGSADARLQQLIGEDPALVELLANASWDTPARELGGYAANVRSMHGPGFALLGNAAEFLDPVFSSGVTIAMRSASVAAGVLDRQLRGERVDWETEFSVPLRRGVDAFRAYVTAWYDGRFQQIIFARNQSASVRRMLCAILAGYAWDETNPFVAEPERRLDALYRLCAS